MDEFTRARDEKIAQATYESCQGMTIDDTVKWAMAGFPNDLAGKKFSTIRRDLTGRRRLSRPFRRSWRRGKGPSRPPADVRIS